ncbi:MAG TPA: alpha/beta family hydrolase [Bacteroidota bacterium]
MIKPQSLKFAPTKNSGKVSALFLRPPEARWLFVFGHGAGAGMEHPFMETTSRSLAEAGIATFRYQFPYMENKSGRPDPQPILLATVRAAVETASGTDGSLPLLAGGKSMGGRMTSLAASAEDLPRVRGLAFFGFPLHSPGRQGTERAEHLKKVSVPMLFLQGTRDKLAELTLLRPVCLALPRATLKIIEGGDHSFNVLKSSGKSSTDALHELIASVVEWTGTLA